MSKEFDFDVSAIVSGWLLWGALFHTVVLWITHGFKRFTKAVVRSFSFAFFFTLFPPYGAPAVLVLLYGSILSGSDLAMLIPAATIVVVWLVGILVTLKWIDFVSK